MPFPLAHPAAVLPLKRLCPRFLSLGGLIVGSIVPDLGYALSLGRLAHSFVGSFEFSLPVGLVLLVLIYVLRHPVVELLPERHQRVFLPLCRQPVPNLPVMVVSILIGAWTHILWDSFTHKQGWLAEHIPVLEWQVAQRQYHQLLICDLLWYICSFVGVVWLFLVYEQWRQTADPAAVPASSKTRLRNALIVGLLVLPIESFHLHYQSAIGSAIVGVCSLALVTGIALCTRNQPTARSQKES